MAQGIGEVLTFAIGVAISPVPIIAVILMLFSGRAKVNGPMFLAGWVVALAVVSGAAYLLSDAGNASTDITTDDDTTEPGGRRRCCTIRGRDVTAQARQQAAAVAHRR
jgi:hypothetical protein